MKKTVRKVSNVIAIALVLSMLLSTTVFADVTTVEVKGYLDSREYTQEELSQMKSYFSISNVKELLGNIDVYGEKVNLYETAGSTTINSLAEYGEVFEAYKVTVKDNNYEINENEKIMVTSGKVNVGYLDNSKLDEYGYPLESSKTIDASELGNDNYYMARYLPGCTISLTEPGYYYVIYQVPAAAGAAHAFIKVTVSEGDVSSPVVTEPVVIPSSVVTALPTSSKVLVNGKDVSFEAYNIEGNNYFKLRDVALTVNGTEKQFGVEWDGIKQAINLTSNSVYQTIGGEMAKGDGTTKNGLLNSSPIYKDGVDIQLKAYNISGNNYFKLRDLAQAFNIGVTWDNTTQTIEIDTTRSYTD